MMYKIIWCDNVIISSKTTLLRYLDRLYEAEQEKYLDKRIRTRRNKFKQPGLQASLTKTTY